jgi:cytochrome b pre-mRNA-processing protein 3
MAAAQQDGDPGGLLGRWRARRQRFYARWGVPDTNDGRLEMIGLHVALVARRLGREGEVGRELAQELLELLIADVDRTLRELGVGDLSVGKKVRRIADSLMGRAAGLEAALAERDRAAVATVLARNLYVTGVTPPPDSVDALASYLLALDNELAGFPGPTLLAGELPPPREPA